ncbi:hypothetical protein [Loktanella sp. M215]|uniref:hypothetical protein n=1 Tax=Loktanella sp. M215 TaxID=2675431 RepID=UPI001F2E7F11|nr:hypothetical protein [Loktanella sp. M215]MCF7699322.1 hypothetical protein [Loktanella sp. M215]
MRLIWIILLLTVLSSASHAGAWPRDKGELFIAAGGNFLLSTGAELPVHYDPTVYGEYGLTDRLTLGLDFYTADKGRIASGFTFISVPVGSLQMRNRASVSLGYGYRLNPDASTEALMRIGLSVGRGLNKGWLAADTSATFGTLDTIWRPKADFTWGRSWSDRWTTTLQLQTGEGYYDDYYAKISPTAIFSLSDRFKINLGAVKALTGDGGSAMKLETWLTF